MKELKLAETEMKFAKIIWEREPIQSGELVKVCEEKLEWKKSTTYTVLKKVCNKGIFKNENSVVSALMTKDEFLSKRGEEFIDEAFGGSLFKFLTSFVERKKLSEDERREIKEMIDNYKED
ncbi:MAG: BlaI/MecI/CopY family transcriptional regulator [Clostridium sp.]|uniref:BlaI/MecI/CopY family transcriptional regulator n=1 Tax=Clostridium sp. TaxID=1506 RepID=UPI003EE7E002